jgi:hypothetical protein
LNTSLSQVAAAVDTIEVAVAVLADTAVPLVAKTLAVVHPLNRHYHFLLAHTR